MTQNPSPPHPPDAPPFERLGGRSAVHALVEQFYAKVLDVPGLSRFFLHADIERVKRHQTEVIVAALGGPQAISDAQIVRAHEALGLTQGDLDLLLLLFRETLEEGGVDAALIGNLIVKMRSYGRLITAPD